MNIINNSISKIVNFSAVGATDVKPLNIDAKLKEEKLSRLIMEDITRSGVISHLHYTEYIHPGKISIPRCNSHKTDERPLYFTATKNGKKYYIRFPAPTNMGTVAAFLNPLITSFSPIQNNAGQIVYEEFTTDPLKEDDFYADSPYCIPVKPGAPIESISLFDITRTASSIPKEVRMSELFSYFTIEEGAFAPYKLRPGFHGVQFQVDSARLPTGNYAYFCKLQQHLGKFYSSGLPRSYRIYSLKLIPKEYERIPNTDLPRMFYAPVLSTKETIELPQPIFYEPLGPMVYDLNAYKCLPYLRLQRLFFNPDNCGLCQALIPTVIIEGKAVMTVMPNGKKLPIYNANRVGAKETKIVVVCGCIEDAEALQRANMDVEHVAFTACVEGQANLSDWSPITGKAVALLISNHSGRPVEEEFEHAAEIHDYLANAKLGIPEFTFVRRLVEYPESDGLATPADLASAYYHHRPKVVSGSVKDMDEEEFEARFEMIRSEESKLPVYLRPMNDAKKNEYDEDVDHLVRGILYKGATTELAAKSGTGKTRLSLWLGRFVVCGYISFLPDRLWVRSGNPETPHKVIYWCFDDETEKKLKKMRKLYKTGLAEQFAQNFFIDAAPESVRKSRDVKTYKKELMKYICKGTPGMMPALLIVDTLSDLCGQEHIDDALNLLADLKRQAAPDMSVLALHHVGETDKILKGSSAKRKPRLVLLMEPGNKKSASISVRPSTNCVLKLSYDPATNISLAPVEKNIPFFIRPNGEGGYSVVDPAWTPEEFGKLLVDYYKHWDDLRLTNEEVARLLECSKSTVEKKFSAKSDELEKLYAKVEKTLAELAEKAESPKETSKFNRSKAKFKKEAEDTLMNEVDDPTDAADDLPDDEIEDQDELDVDNGMSEDTDDVSEEPEE